MSSVPHYMIGEDYYGARIPPQKEGETDENFEKRAIAELSRAGCHTEAAEVEFGARWDSSPEAVMTVRHIAIENLKERYPAFKALLKGHE
jgi:hypothetical protein